MTINNKLMVIKPQPQNKLIISSIIKHSDWTTMIKNPFCRQRLRSAAGKPGRPLSPLSLLDRIREAVFRFIMFSALSKGGATTNKHDHSGRSAQPSDFGCFPNDPHHSEAVADCIEFLKKSAATSEDGPRESTVGGYADAQTLPVGLSGWIMHDQLFNGLYIFFFIWSFLSFLFFFPSGSMHGVK